MSEETRRARAAYALHDAKGAVTAQGEAVAVIGNDGVTVGPVIISFLDADELRVGDHRLEIECWPGGMLVLDQLGRRFDTFTAELGRARRQARVAGLLAHGIALPIVFPAEVDDLPVECQVYHTHVTLAPDNADPWQIPLGALQDIETVDDPHAVALVTAEGRTTIRKLARRRDEFFRAVTERRNAQTALLHSLTGLTLFADGLGVERSRLPDFAALLERWSSPERTDCAATLLAKVQGGEPRFGLVQLLDPDRETLRAPAGLPEHWGSFLLVPVGSLTVLEILAGPGAATYLFSASIESVNRDLQLLHFRRAALALSGKEAEPAPGNPHRLALRRLEPLQRLRAATRARVIHHEGWGESVAREMGRVG